MKVKVTHKECFPRQTVLKEVGKLTLHASLCGQFLLSYMSYAVLFGEFLLHAPSCFMWGVSPTRHLLFYVGSFFYMPHPVLYGEFLLHALCCFLWGVSLTRPVLFYVWSFSYMPLAVLCGEFLFCLLYTSPSPRDRHRSRMPSSA